MDGAGAGSEGAAGPCATGDGVLGASATVPVPVVALGVGVGSTGVLTLADGDGSDDGAVDDREGCTTGLLLAPPLVGAEALLLADAPGDADALVLAPGFADAPAVPLTLAPGDGVVPSLAVGMFPGATLSLPPDGCPDRPGDGEVSTLPAGASSFCPGTGNHGASELPDSNVMTMTTAYTAHAIPTAIPNRRYLRLRRPDSSTKTGRSDPSLPVPVPLLPPAAACWAGPSSWTVTSSGSAAPPSDPDPDPDPVPVSGAAPQGSARIPAPMADTSLPAGGSGHPVRIRRPSLAVRRLSLPA
ncbi:hypothetical protein OG194_28435 [Streptomyces sp. NBC_01288]|uniref:hypothetical protein n=1 Tax=Streptomyces sp. NBC_01288 TaxID=2903814 RepID=UPI002E0F5CC3|nr:hypothetical protein OG194_28435 [Streptomyces sp. NBC_01288]